MITFNNIKSAVMAAIQAAYPGVRVDDEDSTVPFAAGDICVRMLPGIQSHLMGRRYKLTASFDILYFGTAAAASHDMAQSLYAVLEAIELPGGRSRGTAMSYEIVDQVLHFLVSYDIQVMKEQEPQIKMRTLTQEVKESDG